MPYFGRDVSVRHLGWNVAVLLAESICNTRLTPCRLFFAVLLHTVQSLLITEKPFVLRE